MQESESERAGTVDEGAPLTMAAYQRVTWHHTSAVTIDGELCLGLQGDDGTIHYFRMPVESARGLSNSFAGLLVQHDMERRLIGGQGLNASVQTVSDARALAGPGAKLIGFIDDKRGISGIEVVNSEGVAVATFGRDREGGPLRRLDEGTQGLQSDPSLSAAAGTSTANPHPACPTADHSDSPAEQSQSHTEGTSTEKNRCS